jgi:protease-4
MIVGLWLKSMKPIAVGCLVVLLMLALVVALLIGSLVSSATLELGSSRAKLQEEFSSKVLEPAQKQSSAKIARIDLDGIIEMGESEDFSLHSAGSKLEAVKASLKRAQADPAVKAIVLRIHSPGGDVTASDVLHRAVKQAASVKPVVAMLDGMAASGGYYVACGASRILCSPTTLTGSIGVIMEHFSYHGLFGKLGLGSEAITSGQYKDILNGARPMREDERQMLKALVGEMYERFLSVVADGRKLKADALRNTVADGRILSGNQALAAKLVDQLGFIEDAYEEARKLGKAPGASVVRFSQHEGWLSLLRMQMHSWLRPAQTQVHLGPLPQARLLPGIPYYLPANWLH